MSLHSPTTTEVCSFPHVVRDLSVSDMARNPEFLEMHSGTTEPPLCLMIGYTDGMQIWSVSVSRTSNPPANLTRLPFLISLVLCDDII